MGNRNGFDRQEELDNCTFVKTVLMLLVVLYHSIVFWSGNWFTKNPYFSAIALSKLANWLNSVHVYGFVLVSGYIFCFLHSERGKYKKFFPFVLNKARRLLIPYGVIALIWVIPLSQPYMGWEIKELISHFALGIGPSQLWFLLMLFDVFVMFWPLSSFFRNHHIYGAIAIILIYGIGLIGNTVFPNVFQIFSACQYMMLFWLGFKIRQYGSEWLRKIPVLVWLVIDVLLFALTLYLRTLDGLIFTLLRYGFNFWLHVVGALMAFVILQKLADRIRWKESKIWRCLSKSAMPVYLLHQQVIYLFIHWLNGKVNPYIHAMINFVGAVAISLLIASCLMKFKMTRILIGEK